MLDQATPTLENPVQQPKSKVADEVVVSVADRAQQCKHVTELTIVADDETGDSVDVAKKS